jgi:hypothetical protein
MGGSGTTGSGGESGKNVLSIIAVSLAYCLAAHHLRENQGAFGKSAASRRLFARFRAIRYDCSLQSTLGIRVILR